MKKTTISLLLLPLLACWACDDDNTYANLYEDMTITVAETEGGGLYADSASTALVEVEFGRTLEKEQEATITTSHGTLYRMPFTPTDAGAEHITLKPFSDRATLLLKASTLTPTDPVYVSVTVDSVTKEAVATFKPAKPNTFYPDPDLQIVDAGETPTVSVKLYRNNNGFCSNGIKFNALCVPANPSADTLLWTVHPFAYSQDNQVQFPIQIVRHWPGAKLWVYVWPADGSLPEQRVEVWFE